MTRYLRSIALSSLFCGLILGHPEEGQASGRIGEKLGAALASLHPAEPLVVWVYLRDKGPGVLEKRLPPLQVVSEASLRRRANAASSASLVDETDVPLDDDYVLTLSRLGVQIRHHSKWLNAVSAAMSREQLERVRALAFVTEIELVGRFAVKRQEEPASRSLEGQTILRKGEAALHLPYGPSLEQLALINVPPVHDAGNYAQGVLVGVFDNGFRLPRHEAFDSLKVVATYDFVDYKISVVPRAPGHGHHGVATLSAIAGYAPGRLIGPAFGASFLLARTENDSSETPFEEDKWVAAIEWADSIGVQVTSTSLGYLDYNAPYPSWTWENMDGRTTVISRAAAMAVRKGIVVVNSAGNEGYSALHNTLNAPADADSVVAVGAVDMNGYRAAFSSVGPTTSVPPHIKPDVMAPGVAVLAASSVDTSGYQYASGTSLACPLAAGVAALLVKAAPTATAMQIVDAMRMTAGNSGAPNNLVGWGVVNAAAAFQRLGGTLPSTPGFALLQNYPNPFNERTTLLFDIPEPAYVVVRVYDLLGRTVATVLDGQIASPGIPITWVPRTAHGNPLASGVYICRLTAAGASGKSYTGQVKMLMIK